MHKAAFCVMAQGVCGLSIASLFVDLDLQGINKSSNPAVTLDTGKEVYSLAWHPEGKRIAFLNEGGQIRISQNHDLARPAIDLFRGELTSTRTIALSSDGRAVAVGSNECEVLVWETSSNRLRLSLIGHEGTVLAVAFSPNGKLLASAGLDDLIKIWDARQGRELITFRGH